MNTPFYLLVTSTFLAYQPVALATECLEGENKLVWADEFDYSGLPDKKKWNYEEGYIRNKELQYYEVESIENSYVKDGYLTIEAKYDATSNHPYSSASITTEKRAAWLYGKIEVRASIPHVQGTWPAIWMLGDNFRQVNWPRSGEIDIMEHIGRHPNRIHSNAIYYDYSKKQKNTRNSANITIDSVRSFNNYAIEWNEEEIVYLVNDVPFNRFDISKAGTVNNPFNKPFYLIMNLALGGNWGGNPNSDFTSEKFIIDYVRVYQSDCSIN